MEEVVVVEVVVVVVVADKLTLALERDGYKVVEEFVLGRYIESSLDFAYVSY